MIKIIMMIQNNISKWNKINWKQANEELKANQAELYEALKNEATRKELARLSNKILMSFSARLSR